MRVFDIGKALANATIRQRQNKQTHSKSLHSIGSQAINTWLGWKLSESKDSSITSSITYWWFRSR